MGSDAGTAACTLDVSCHASPSPLWGEGARRAGEGETLRPSHNPSPSPLWGEGARRAGEGETLRPSHNPSPSPLWGEGARRAGEGETLRPSHNPSPSPLWGEGARRAGEGETPQFRTLTRWPAVARWATLAFALLAATVATGATGSAPPVSDALLRLVPPDAAVVVTVDHLRDHAAAFLKSTLAAGSPAAPGRAGVVRFGKIPPVRAVAYPDRGTLWAST